MKAIMIAVLLVILAGCATRSDEVYYDERARYDPSYPVVVYSTESFEESARESMPPSGRNP